MSNQVYANMMEVSCKASAGKSICAFPDVCFTPPQTPATPPGVPIPYPNTGMASDCTDGSTSVKISGEEVMLKNKSYFKKSSGDEAGAAPKKGVVTSKNSGKVYFTMWSMDVKVEGENVVRHLDMTTHNHASQGPNTTPWPHIDEQTMAAGGGACKDDVDREKSECSEAGYAPYGEKDVCKDAGLSGGVVQSKSEAAVAGFASPAAWADDASKKSAANKCLAARRCRLAPYDAPKDGVKGCCPSQTADHLVPKASFYVDGYKDGKGQKLDEWPNYNPSKAPCMCAEGGSNTAGSHGLRHAHHKANGPGKGKMQSFDAEVTLAASGANEVFKGSGDTACSPGCIEQQLKQGHKGMGEQDGQVKHSPSGSTLSNEEISARAQTYTPEVIAP